MEYYKNPRIEPAKNGYLVCYDVYGKSHDAYDGLKHLKYEKEVFTDGKKALKRFDEIAKLCDITYKMSDDDSMMPKPSR